MSRRNTEKSSDQLSHTRFHTDEHDAENSARQAGYRSLRQAAAACGVSIADAIRYRPWEYAEYLEEDFHNVGVW